MGLHDGVSRLWILRREHGLDVQGFENEVEAIDALIRAALTWGSPETRERIESAVAKALTHLDETPCGDAEHEEEADHEPH